MREPQNHPGAGRGTPELVLVQEGQEERLQGPDPTSPAPGLGRQAAQPRKVGGTGIRERQSHPSTRRASQGLLAGRRTEQIRGCRSRPDPTVSEVEGAPDTPSGAPPPRPRSPDLTSASGVPPLVPDADARPQPAAYSRQPRSRPCPRRPRFPAPARRDALKARLAAHVRRQKSRPRPRPAARSAPGAAGGPARCGWKSPSSRAPGRGRSAAGRT